MASNQSLEDMPQLVLDKILSFLNHKELLALEQASKMFKFAVDKYFSITDQVLIGYLPEVSASCVKGLVKLVMRCGTRLRIIRIDVSHQWCDVSIYEHYYHSILKAVGNKCPNIERIIMSPMRIKKERSILCNFIRDVYATHVYESTGKPCKLRSLTFVDTDKEHQLERILNLYPNLEELNYVCDDPEKLRIFSSLLHRYIENGLKDLKISSMRSIAAEMVFELSENGKNLRTLYIDGPLVRSYDDIAIINKTQCSKNLRLELLVDPDAISLFNENVCEFIFKLAFITHNENDDYSSMVKMSNLETITMHSLKQLRAVSQGSFTKLTEITVMMETEHLCDNSHLCAVQSSLHHLLADKGNQLTKLYFAGVCYLDALLVALKYCKAAIVIEIGNYVKLGNATTYEDVLAIFDLPNIQELSIWDTDYPIYNLMKKAVREKPQFKIAYKKFNDNDFNDKINILLTKIVN